MNGYVRLCRHLGAVYVVCILYRVQGMGHNVLFSKLWTIPPQLREVHAVPVDVSFVHSLQLSAM